MPQVAQAGRIVLLSFHQPSPAMFDLLDRAFLMACGHVLFCGEPGAAAAHLAKAGLPCPQHTAVAEHMLSAVSDPAMLAALMAHAHVHGPFAGIAAVRSPPAHSLGACHGCEAHVSTLLHPTAATCWAGQKIYGRLGGD